MPRIVPANFSSIREAAEILRAGGVVAFPTETVYGLGACTFNELGIERVYELKGRPADNPLIAHVRDVAQAREVVAEGAWDERCEMLARRFWPGPLTLVLPKSDRVPDRATASRATVAVRAPRHTTAQALLAAVGQPISAPSANRSGRISPTTAQHVMDEFADVSEARHLLVLDGGPCDVGIESTVLDVKATPQPRILRHGSVTLEQVREILGEDVASPALTTQDASPGTSPAHYAPRTPMLVVSTDHLPETLKRLSDSGLRAAVLVFDAGEIVPPHVALAAPRLAERYARELYQRLREADASGSDWIIVEAPPDDSHIWRAVHDRLRRASAGRPGSRTHA